MTKILPFLFFLNFQFPQTERIYNNAEIEVWSAWPNPTSGIANLAFHFKVSTPLARYEVLISNILGSELSRHRLWPSETSIKISFEENRPGVYFYTLAEDFKHVATRKIIVQSTK